MTVKKYDPVKGEDPLAEEDPELRLHEDELSRRGAEEKPTRRLTSLFERIGLEGRALTMAHWLSVALGVWLLLTAVNAIGNGFELAAGDQAEELFAFATNPFIALMIGIVATALTQSSSTTTSVTVGLVAGGLPLEIAIPVLMGANMGTTMTNTLVSLGMIRDKEQFRRGFSVATVQDFYNLMAVALILPVELLTGFLERSSQWLSEQTAGAEGGPVAYVFERIGDGVSLITDPGADALEFGLGFLPDVWQGVIMILLGIGLILFVINFISSMLKVLLVGTAKKVLHGAIGRGPVAGVGSGVAVTVMVQSSSTTTSLAVPLAGSGHFGLKELYPFTVGANLGTTMTALIAAFSFTGEEGVIALQAALVHLLFNVTALLVIFSVPYVRSLPPLAAGRMGALAGERKVVALLWVIGLFVALPLALILGSVML
ncbi:Na/Pi cotransporter family protein [Nesterenkonia flava]|uniref:Na/Pi cotransporter family protein n=1 Tax=Nesterenkonia flava TaxID=469799 RepID=A0ABU1FSS7_9MICC|nr:Na/Pi cotransporter family protein [Nesterenkonia flava]MDR5711191.1 Na/Pi cotransporter family protein [Nesterenkonia flava]